MEQHRRKSGHHRFSGCKKLCRGVSDFQSGDFCRDCKVRGDFLSFASRHSYNVTV